MKTEPQCHAELATVAALIDGIAVAMLTTASDDGTLASRPMAALEMDAQGAVWFFIDLRQSTLEPMRVANLAFTDAARSTYVSLSGRIEIDSDRRRIVRLWTPKAWSWFPDGPESRYLALLKFVPDVADCWSASNSMMRRVFGPVSARVEHKAEILPTQDPSTGLAAATPPSGASTP